MVEKNSKKFKYYFIAFGAFMRGYAHIRKAIFVDGIHLYEKYQEFLLFAIAQDTKNHIYPIAHCVVGKENDASWSFSFKKLKAIVVDEPDLYIISDWNTSVASGIAKHYSHTHYGLCTRHLRENIHKNYHCSTYFRVYQNVAYAYDLKEFTDHFTKFKDSFLEVAAFLEHDIRFNKWSKAHFSAYKFYVWPQILESTIQY